MVRAGHLIGALLLIAVTGSSLHSAHAGGFDINPDAFVTRFETEARAAGDNSRLAKTSCAAGDKSNCTYRYNSVGLNVNVTPDGEHVDGVIVICAKGCEGVDNVIATLLSLRVLAPGFPPSAYGRWARIFNEATAAGRKPMMEIGPARVTASVGGLGILTYVSAGNGRDPD